MSEKSKQVLENIWEKYFMGQLFLVPSPQPIAAGENFLDVQENAS